MIIIITTNKSALTQEFFSLLFLVSVVLTINKARE